MLRCMVIATESVRHGNYSHRALRKWNSTQAYFWVVWCSSTQYCCQGQDFILLMTRLNPIVYIFKVFHPLMDIWLIPYLGYWAYWYKKDQCMGLGVCLIFLSIISVIVEGLDYIAAIFAVILHSLHIVLYHNWTNALVREYESSFFTIVAVFVISLSSW